MYGVWDLNLGSLHRDQPLAQMETRTGQPWIHVS